MYYSSPNPIPVVWVNRPARPSFRTSVFFFLLLAFTIQWLQSGQAIRRPTRSMRVRAKSTSSLRRKTSDSVAIRVIAIN